MVMVKLALASVLLLLNPSPAKAAVRPGDFSVKLFTHIDEKGKSKNDLIMAKVISVNSQNNTAFARVEFVGSDTSDANMILEKNFPIGLKDSGEIGGSEDFAFVLEKCRELTAQEFGLSKECRLFTAEPETITVPAGTFASCKTTCIKENNNVEIKWRAPVFEGIVRTEYRRSANSALITTLIHLSK